MPPGFAFVRTPMWDKADPEAREALEELAKELGAQEEIDLPVDFDGAWPALRAIMAADMAHNLDHFADKGKVSKHFTELVAEGRAVTATQYTGRASRCAPLCPRGRWKSSRAIRRRHHYAVHPRCGAAWDRALTGDPMFCSFWTLTGLPALNLPILADDEGLPIGVQLIGAPGRDERIVADRARSASTSLSEG